MSSNDYYYGNQPHSGYPGSSMPYSNDPHQPYTPSPVSTPAPPYPYGQSGAGTPSPYNPESYGTPPPVGHPQAPGKSPFDSVFDDNAYPANNRPYDAPYGGHNTGDISQQGHYQDTSYSGRLSPGPPVMGNDIPLQDRSGKHGPIDDHVYDAPEEGRSGHRRHKKKVRLGELGMIGADRKRIPWVVYIFTAAQIAVFIAEIVRNGILTGSPIMIKPQFNPMIGPSTQVLINMGARYVPCMHNVEQIQGAPHDKPVLFLCPNATKNDQVCPLSELCGFGGKTPDPVFDGNAKQKPEPNQWFRFIIPIFMHAGLIHIGFNLLLQMTIAKEMEMAIGPVRFFLVYMSAGIFGFVMGGNYAAPAIASTGASGSLFGIIALTLLDLLYSWKDRRSPVKDLLFILLDMVIAFGLGLLPGLDNFSHIGGFLMGLFLGICVLHSPNALRKRIGQDVPYSAVHTGSPDGPTPFMKSPIGFFKGRKPLWWAWWLVRVAALIVIIIVFIVLLNNFYKYKSNCKWCKYLSCIPVNNWCELGTIKDQS